MADDVTPSLPILSEDPWFSDGDIILSVTEDGAEHHFCVHRDTLTRSSPVFRDMFSMPQPPGEGRLLVFLQDDSVHDVTALLRELYVASAREPQNVTLDVALGILRLSYKYQIDGLQRRMRQRLQKDWPLSYVDYLARLEYLGSSECRIFDAVKVIETADHCEANELLPTAFFELSCARGILCEHVAKSLSPKNIARLWIGRMRVESRLSLLANGDPNPESVRWSCLNTDEPTDLSTRRRYSCCTHSEGFVLDGHYRHICSSVFPTFRAVFANRSVFGGLSGITILQQFCGEDLGQDACSSCKLWFDTILDNYVQDFWDSVPMDFDLPPINSELSAETEIPSPLDACQSSNEYVLW